MASDTMSDLPPPGCEEGQNGRNATIPQAIPNELPPVSSRSDAPTSSTQCYGFHRGQYSYGPSGNQHFSLGNTFLPRQNVSTAVSTPYRAFNPNQAHALPISRPVPSGNFMYRCNQPGFNNPTSGYGPTSMITSSAQNGNNHGSQLPSTFGYQPTAMRPLHGYGNPAPSEQQQRDEVPKSEPFSTARTRLYTQPSMDSLPTSLGASSPANLVLFTRVPGRLTVLGESKKLPVTLAEIRRRLNLPECLNRSNLSALLRKAKNRDGGSRLTTQLKKFQIELTQGRRKAVSNSSFTSLLELEAMNLATDFATTSDQYFPFISVAYETLLTLKSSEELNAKRIAVETAVPVIMNIASILRRDKSPVVNMPLQQTLLMHPESQREFTVFSLLTHGFGTPAHLVAMITLLSTLKTILQMLNDPVGFCQRNNRPVPAWLDPRARFSNEHSVPSASTSNLQRPFPSMPHAVPLKIPTTQQQVGSNQGNDDAATVERIMHILHSSGPF